MILLPPKSTLLPYTTLFRSTQVSRLGNPLINEVIIPIGKKDRWNAREPRNDSDFLTYYKDPELQRLLPVLYPGDRKSTRLNSSHLVISYAIFYLHKTISTHN